MRQRLTPPALHGPKALLGAVALVVLASLMLWAGVYKLYLASLGEAGYMEETLINAVHEALHTTLFRIHQTAFLIIVGALEVALGLALFFTLKRKRLTCSLNASYITAASVIAFIANPSLMGTLDCDCWGTWLLDFDLLWQVLARNALLIAVLLWLARTWKPRVGFLENAAKQGIVDQTSRTNVDGQGS